jgi:hypothetical protein
MYIIRPTLSQPTNQPLVVVVFVVGLAAAVSCQITPHLLMEVLPILNANNTKPENSLLYLLKALQPLEQHS